MCYYIRKITRAKWPEEVKEIKDFNVGDISADAITGCIRTTSNKLSLWKVDNTTDNINNILPIITGFEKPNRCEFIYIDETKLKEVGIQVDQSTEDALTCLEDLLDTHYNAIVNDYKGLGSFADVVIKSLGSYVRISEKEVKNKIIQLLENGIIKESDLKTSMLDKLNINKV